MKRPLAAAVVALGVLLACDEPVQPPTTGSILLQIIVPEPQVSEPTRAAPAGAEKTEGAQVRESEPPKEPPSEELIGGARGQRVSAEVQPPALDIAGHLTRARIKLEGPTPRDSSPITPGSTVTISGLTPGSYNVLVFGYVGDSVDYFARTDGVSVAAGSPTTATITFQSFRPTLRDFTSPTYSFKVRANFPPVPNATGYTLDWARNAAFTGLTSVALSDTTHLLTLSDTGSYYVRVYAQNASVTPPRASDTKSFRILADTTGNTSAQAANLRALVGSSGVGAFSSTVTGLNIFPAADADWFKVRACTFDRLQVETRAVRLNPPSTLNTVVRVFTSSNTTTPIAENDNLHVDTTDSRLEVVLPSQDSFRVQVASAGGNTMGHYELRVELQKGPQNQDTNCVRTPALSKSIVTVSQSTIQAGGTATFTLVARDTAGVQIPTGGSTVAFSLSGSGTSGGLIGPVTDHGDGTYSATFTGQTAGTARDVSATIDGQALTSTKPTITVTTGPAARAQFVVEPAGATAGTIIQPDVKVGIADAYGNLLSTATGVVTLTILNNPSGGTLFGTVSRTLVSGTGIATFNDLRIDRAGDGYTLRAASGSLSPDTSAAFSITAGAAAKLAFSVQPPNTLPGIAMSPAPQVQVQDAFGNRVAGAVNQITVSIANNPVGGVLSGANVRNSADGVAVFDSLSIDKIGTGYTLKAKSPGLDSAVSNSFNVSIGSAARLDVTGQPSNASAGQTISPAITVAIRDAGGNLVNTAEDSVFIALGADPSSGTATLSGTRRVKAASGIATFNNLSINRSGTGYTLIVTSGSLTPDTTAAFNITAGTKFRLAFTVPPGNTISNSYMSPAPQVAVQDAFGNTVTSATDLITIAIGTNPGGGTLLGTPTRNAVAGVARFDSLSINAAGNGYTLTATSGSLVSATSAAFNIEPSPEVDPTRSAAAASPNLGIVANGTDSTIVTVTVRDPAGNAIPGQTVQLAATGTNNTLTQPAGTTNASGVAIGRLKSTRAEVKTITVTVNPGPNQVVLSQQPTVQFVADTTTISASLSTVAANPASPDSIAGDGVQASAITVTVRDANSNPVAGQTVQLATSGAGNLTQPGTTNSSGVATGSITRNSGGVDSITATVNPGGTAVIITQRPVVKFFATSCGDPNATTSTVAVSPDTVAASGTDSSTVTVTVLDCGSSPVEGATVQLSLSGTGNFVRQPSTTTNASGVTTGKVSSTVAGSKTVTATINPGPTQRVIVQKPAVVFRPGAPAALTFTVQPPSTTAGTVMSPSVQVAVVDNLGNVVDTATATITLAVASGPDTLSGTTSVSASGGVAVFGDVFIKVAASGYTLSAGTAAYGGLGMVS
ncbi:MAG TPA: invasin domain 3-containing protein, partial [Gemmatimonadales bacterium]|nr:invasin domain 3-containing protein [Gemmatimonadales bacterium]